MLTPRKKRMGVIQESVPPVESNNRHAEKPLLTFLALATLLS